MFATDTVEPKEQIMSEQAIANEHAIRTNTYPGRIVLAGLDKTGKNLVLACAIMGRSKNSRNRVYSNSGGRVYIELAQPDPKADTSLTIYNAMDEWRKFF